jgi:hypothetical protein
MSQAIRIKAGAFILQAELNDSPTAAAISAALPVRGRGNRWGDEIYFRIPVSQEPADDACADVQVGELAYWPPGQAFCIFFGRTPMSVGPQPRAASPVNVVGRVKGDASQLRQVPDGTEVLLEKL